MKNINNRIADASDIDKLLALINHIQPHVPWNEEMLRWQYFDSPGGPARVYIAEVDADIVAQYVAVPYPFQTSGGKITKAWMAQDVMTHPDFRGQGILHSLAKRCLDDIDESGDVGFTFPNEKSAGSFRRNGWNHLCSVPLRALQTADAPDTPQSLLREVARVEDLPIPELPTVFGVHRTAGYLKWRYSKPGQAYRLFEIEGSGYVVLKKYKKQDDAVLHICDAIVPDVEKLGHVLKEIVGIARSQNCSTLTAWLTKAHPYAGQFDNLGLRLVPELPVSIFVTGPRETVAEIVDPAEWHITQGDSDVY